MYKRIIVAVDGSNISKRALREAVNLAREQESALRIVHVIDVVTFNVDTPHGVAEYEAAVRKSGDAILKHAMALARKAQIRAETKLLEVQQATDRIADAIVREAKAWRGDLIVIGTHGRRGVGHLFLGSVAESVIRIASVPVLLIRGT